MNNRHGGVSYSVTESRFVQPVIEESEAEIFPIFSS